jgi:hypothetical protein
MIDRTIESGPIRHLKVHLHVLAARRVVQYCITEAAMATSVRMDLQTERLLDQLARERGLTKSQVIRDAVRLAAGKARLSGRGSRPFDAFRGIIGSVRGGPPDLSERTGRSFRRLLANRAANRS